MSMNKKTGVRLLSEQTRWISLRCPVVLSSAKLTLDQESGKYEITVDLEYPMGTTAQQAIRSVILVVRIADKNGGAILTADGGELSAKQIRFGEEGFPGGESTTFSFAVDIQPEEGTKFGPPEVSVSRIHFEDGSVVDYLRGDFFPMPASPVPLERKYDEEGIAEIRSHLGQQASVVPEKLSPLVWRCTCGELCQEEECPNCKASRTDVFAYFGDTEEVLHPGPDYHKILKIALIVAASVVGVLALTLTAILLVKNRGNNDPPAETTPGITAPPTGPDAGTLASERARYYMDAGRYEDAWAVAEKEADAAFLKSDICNAAIAAYREAGDYESACLFGRRLVEKCGGDPADLTRLYGEAVDAYIAREEWEKACNLAKDDMQDDQKLAEAADSWIAAIKAGKYAPSHADSSYAECLWVLSTYLPGDSARIKAVVDEGVTAYLADKKFAEAEKLAEADPDGSAERLYEIRRSAVEYYLAQGDYLNAFDTAKRTDDAELIQSVCGQIPDAEIRAHLPAYISYLWGDPAKLRTILAHSVAQNRFAALINMDGSVSFGAKQLFVPALRGYFGAKAVSVAAGTDHVAILLDTGRVVTVNWEGSVDKSGGLSGTSAIAVSAAADYTLVLLDSGKVTLCGNSPFSAADKSTIESLTDVISVAAGEKHALFLRSNGTVVAVGDNGKGQCGVEGWSDIVQIAAGGSHSVGLKSDGTLVGCGNSLSGRMDFSGWKDVVAISAGQSATAAILKDGSVRYAGGVIGAKPADPTGLSGITDIAVGQFGMLVRDSSGRVRSLGQYAPDLSGYPDR